MSCGCGKQRTRNVEKLWSKNSSLERQLAEAIERGVRLWYRGRVLYHQGYIKAIEEIQEAFRGC